MSNRVRTGPFDAPPPTSPAPEDEGFLSIECHDDCTLDAGHNGPCKEPDYDGPSDDELSDFYGGGGTRPMSEQIREAFDAKKRLS